jgi:hypothetical protein
VEAGREVFKEETEVGETEEAEVTTTRPTLFLVSIFHGK